MQHIKRFEIACVLPGLQVGYRSGIALTPLVVKSFADSSIITNVRCAAGSTKFTDCPWTRKLPGAGCSKLALVSCTK